MARQINLTRSALESPGNPATLLSFHFTVLASNAIEMPDQVFVLNQRPLDPTQPTEDKVNDFFGIATPTDIQDLPINEPVPPTTSFRSAFIDIFTSTEIEAGDAWDEIQKGVQALIDALNLSDNLSVVETIVFS